MKFEVAKRGSLLLAAIVLAVSCSALDRQGQDNSAGFAFIRLVRAVEILMDEASYPVIQDTEDLSQWADFFDVGEDLLEDVESEYENWTSEIAALRSKGLLSASDLRSIAELEEAFDVYLSDLQDQATRSRSCLLEDVNPVRCYYEILENDVERWAESALRVQIAIENWMMP